MRSVAQAINCSEEAEGRGRNAVLEFMDGRDDECERSISGVDSESQDEGGVVPIGFLDQEDAGVEAC